MQPRRSKVEKGTRLQPFFPKVTRLQSHREEKQPNPSTTFFLKYSGNQ